LQREFRYGTLSVNEAVSAAVSSAVSITLAFKGYGAWALCWSLVVFHFVSSVMCLHARRGVLSAYIKSWRQNAVPTTSTPTVFAGIIAALPIFWLGTGWTLQQLLNYINTNLGNLMIGGFFGSRVLGTFTVAFDIISIPQLGFGLVLAPVALSVFARIQDDDERMKNAYLKIVFFTSMAASIYSIIIGLCASDIVKTITMLKPGDAWSDTAVFMLYLAPVGLIHTWSCCSGVLWIAKRKIALQIIWTAAMTLSTAVSIAVGAGYGYVGVCAALLARAAIAFSALLYIMGKVSRIPPNSYLKALAPSLICGAAAAAVCLALRHLLTAQFPVHLTARLAICGVLSAAIFAASAMLFYKEKLKTLRRYIKPASESS
jgi:O-antigen/teichoic acid export membrane protein